MAEFKPETFRLHIAQHTSYQLKLERGIPNKRDMLRKYRKDFLQIPSMGGIAIAIALIGRFLAQLHFENSLDLELRVLIYIILFSVVSAILLVGFQMLTEDFYVGWSLDRRSNQLVHLRQNFLGKRKKYYPLSDFSGVNLLPPKKTFLNQYVLALIRKDKSWLALERENIETETDLDRVAQHYQSLVKTICEFMRWPA